MSLSVQVLGSGTPLAHGGRFQSCICLSFGEERLLLDCGSTSMVAMARFGVDPAGVGTILLSHLHSDHIGGVFPFLFAASLHAARGRRSRPVVIGGPPGTADRLQAICDAFQEDVLGAARKAVGVEFVSYDAGDEARVGPVTVRAYPAVHNPEQHPLALRVSVAGRTVAYSGDSNWTEALVDVAEGADLFVCDCHAYEREVPTHLNFRTLMAHRHRLTCRRLVLTHLSDDMLDHLGDVRAALSADPSVVVAEDGLTFAV